MCGPEPPAHCEQGCAQCTPQPQGGRLLTDEAEAGGQIFYSTEEFLESLAMPDAQRSGPGG